MLRHPSEEGRGVEMLPPPLLPGCPSSLTSPPAPPPHLLPQEVRTAGDGVQEVERRLVALQMFQQRRLMAELGGRAEGGGGDAAVQRRLPLEPALGRMRWALLGLDLDEVGCGCVPSVSKAGQRGLAGARSHTSRSVGGSRSEYRLICLAS